MERDELEDLDFCHITTTGRRTGSPHTIEIWFALHGDRIYVLSGGRDGSDWVRNIRANPTVGLQLGDQDLITRAYVVEDVTEDALARRLLVEKYAPRYGGDLTEWGETSLPVAVEFPSAMRPEQADV
jgi:deazaflavin-dependent oxidoreductase (nitroreductase family)